MKKSLVAVKMTPAKEGQTEDSYPVSGLWNISEG